MEESTAHSLCVPSAKGHLAVSGNAVSHGCEATPAPWPLSSTGSQSFHSARCLSPSSDLLQALDNGVEALNLSFLAYGGHYKALVCWDVFALVNISALV